MLRTIKPRIVIDREGWKLVQLEENFVVPPEVFNPQAFIAREKMSRYINEHPRRIYRYLVDGKEYVIDCKTSSYFVNKYMRTKGASEEDIQIGMDISTQFRRLIAELSGFSRKAFGGKSQAGGILECHAETLLDLFGKLYSVDEVHRKAVQEWGYEVNRQTVHSFYARHLKEIERLRDQYTADYTDLSLTKKRSRLDKLSVIFYTYYNKWSKDERLDYSRELRAILEQIRKEIEGEQIQFNIQGKIDVDLTIEVNKTLFDAQKRVPINNMILAMVAAKRGLDPTALMTQLTTSYYKSLTGYGKYNPEIELVHPVDLTYNWNEIERRHRIKGLKKEVEEAKIVLTTGEVEKDAEMNTVKMKLLKILEQDKELNDSRKSGK